MDGQDYSIRNKTEPSQNPSLIIPPPASQFKRYSERDGVVGEALPSPSFFSTRWPCSLEKRALDLVPRAPTSSVAADSLFVRGGMVEWWCSAADTRLYCTPSVRWSTASPHVLRLVPHPSAHSSVGRERRRNTLTLIGAVVAPRVTTGEAVARRLFGELLIPISKNCVQIMPFGI
jgi:hypothetical protein